MAINNGNGHGKNGSSNNGNGFHASPTHIPIPRKALGSITHGSLQKGLLMKLDAQSPVEEARAGKFVVVDGASHEFFAMITDVTLETSAPGVLARPPAGAGTSDALLRRILAGTTAYGTLTLRPQLMRNKTRSEFEPVKTVPGHFSPVGEATEDDIAAIFGAEEAGNGFFHIGSPLDMDGIEVCLDLKKFAERSNGIFGKSGTGKSFLTRIALCGLIKHDAAVNLVFDMHNEYGWMGTVEDKNRQGVRGLKQYFDTKVKVFSLDPAATRRRGCPVEDAVKISYAQITVEDILLLADDLNLTATAAETVYLLEREFKDKWLANLMKMESPDTQKAFCEKAGAHPASLSALYRKLARLVQECEGFLHEQLSDADESIKQILAALNKGTNVVLEFGQYKKPLQYMLVANILTRKIHTEYTKKMEEAQGDKGREPRPLVITIEEAHKFLNPSLAHQTIFGTIAREMRKYNVTLLIVDQRPSGIDDEVLSQIGTRITCLLNDERDIEAVLRGISGAHELRGVLASLDSKQQALLLGHAVPMPVVVKTREYDTEEFRKSMGVKPKFDELDAEKKAIVVKDLLKDWE